MRTRCLVFFTFLSLIFSVISMGLFAPLSHADTAGGKFVPLQARLADSRAQSGGLNVSPLVAGNTYTLPVAGTHGIPASGILAVSITLTTVNATGSGNILISQGPDAPFGTYMVYNTGDTVSNTAIVPVGADGKITLSVTANTNVLVDLDGYVIADNNRPGFVPTASTRVADSRYNNGITGRTSTGGTVNVDLSAFLPSGANAAFVSITVANQATSGWVTAYPVGQPRPSNSLNFDDTNARALSTFVQLSTTRSFSIYVGAGGPVDILVDIEGYSTAASTDKLTVTGSPSRVYDSRTETPLAAGETRSIPLTAAPDLPDRNHDGNAAVIVNITTAATGSTGSGYLKLWPDNGTEPAVSTLNYDDDNTYRSGLAVLQTSPDDMVYVHNVGNAPINLVLDVEGWFTDTSVIGLDPDALRSVLHDTTTGESFAITSKYAPDDVASDTPTMDESAQYPGATTDDATSPFQAGDESAVTPDKVIGSDSRVRVTNTKAWPARAVAMVYFTDTDGRRAHCTGALIAPTAVLTAAHCLYSHGKETKNIYVAPGKNGMSSPFGYQFVIGFGIPSYWQYHSAVGSDYGVVYLAKPISGIGHLGWTTTSPVGATARISGYPYNEEVQYTQWTAVGTVLKKVGSRLYYTIDTDDGESGAPLLRTTGSSTTIVGVHSGYDKIRKQNLASVITPEASSQITGWIVESKSGPGGGGGVGSWARQ